MNKRLKCEAENCGEWAWQSVPTLFGEGYLCKKHLDIYRAAEKKKWQDCLKELEKSAQPSEAVSENNNN